MSYSQDSMDSSVIMRVDIGFDVRLVLWSLSGEGDVVGT